MMWKKSNLSDDAKAYTNRGHDKFMQGDYKGAIADYDRVIALNPGNGGACYFRGVAKFKLGATYAAS